MINCQYNIYKIYFQNSDYNYLYFLQHLQRIQNIMININFFKYFFINIRIEAINMTITKNF